MTGEDLIDSMEYVDAQLVEGAEAPTPAKRMRWKPVAVMAACLAVFVGMVLFAPKQVPIEPVTTAPKPEKLYQRISLESEELGPESNGISPDATVINKAEQTFPTQLPIYEITPRTVTEQEFQQLQEQVQTPEFTAHYHGWKLDGNRVEGSFASYATGTFTMSEEEVEALAWKTFEQIPFLEGEYTYCGIVGTTKMGNAEEEFITTDVSVSFRRVLDGIGVVGDRCIMGFNDSGLTNIFIELYDYNQIGTMDLVPLEEAEARIKTPDAFSMENDSDREMIADALEVDGMRLLLINQHSRGCTILQPVYVFEGTANLQDGTRTTFSSQIIAIPEAYTYEKE